MGRAPHPLPRAGSQNSGRSRRIKHAHHANCFRNGTLPIVLPGREVAALAVRAEAGAALHVDLQDQTVIVDGSPVIHFTIDPSRRTGLLLGLDEVGQSLLHADAITQWQSQDQAQRPWA